MDPAGPTRRRARSVDGRSAPKRVQLGALVRTSAIRRSGAMRSAYLALSSFRREGVLRTVLRFSNSYTCSAGGLISTYWNPQSTVQSASGFSSYAALYDLYRVRMFRLKWTPSQIPMSSGWGSINTAPCVNAPMYTFMDDDTSGATLAGYTQTSANGYQNLRVHQSMVAWERWFRMPIPAQSALGKPSGWLDCAVAGPAFPGIAVVSYSTNGVDASVVGNQDVEFFVEFKNRI